MEDDHLQFLNLVVVGSAVLLSIFVVFVL